MNSRTAEQGKRARLQPEASPYKEIANPFLYAFRPSYATLTFRTRKGQEVDIVLENPAGKVVGIEVKALSTVKSGDFKGLKYLSELLGDRFLRGIVLYTGDQPVPFGSNLYALPVSTLWRTGEMPHEMSKDKT